ncbi:MAG: UDP-N-acetylglucosamine 2-epimerase [Clostridiales bacterium]|nr:UDP-N-acetylglucosamine 2-epimerase [Clostridiales bacterium]
MKKICVVTSGRAEYHLLYETLKGINESLSLELQLIVTGSHLSVSQGYTVDIIKKDGFKIDDEIDILTDSDNKAGIAKSMGLFMMRLADTFTHLKPDILLLLGDRYEILAAASAAVAMNIPIAHIHGGEATEGAIDEQIRHAITKMAHLHFAVTDIYKKNIINMGEQPFRVFNTGAPVVENIKNHEFTDRKTLEGRLGFAIEPPFFIVTYHPVTLTNNSKEQIINLLNALDKFNATILFTASNIDHGGAEINDMIKNYVKSNKNSFFVESLGHLYLDVLKHANLMIGNSSSGIIEAPCMRLPVVNIGDRQNGRLRHENIIDTGYSADEIEKGIHAALDEAFVKKISNMEILYGNGDTSKIIVSILTDTIINEDFICKKLC